jgi:hypothetical protein
MLLHNLYSLLFVALFASAAPAVSSCSQWHEFYGKERWTYTQVRWCFAQRSSSTVITQEQRDPQYYWGGAWYGGQTRKLSWRAKGTVVGQPDFDSGKTSNDGPANKDIYTYTTKFSAGTYDVRLNYVQEGPYWGADAPIDRNVQFQISLGG